MRYFTLEDNGTIDYLDQAEIDALDKAKKLTLKHDWQSPSFSRGVRERRDPVPQARASPPCGCIATSGGTSATATSTKHPQLLRHLEKKGKVTVLTKGASYLLWRGDFSLIRNYLLDHLAWMLSDSTGIPPAYARTAGMVQETYGHYTGAFLEGAQEGRHDEAFIALWRSQQRRRLAVPVRLRRQEQAGAPRGHAPAAVITRAPRGS